MRKLIIIISLALISCAMTAQVNGRYYNEKVGKAYVQVAGGVNYMYAEYSRSVPAGKLMGGSFDITLGKEYTPYIGVSIIGGYNGIKSVNSTPAKLQFDYYPVRVIEGFGMFNYNILNSFAGVKADRRSKLVLSMGPGAVYSFNFKDNLPWGLQDAFNFAVRMGIDYSCMLSNRVALVAQVHQVFSWDDFNLNVGDLDNEMMMKAQLGLRVYLGKNDGYWKPAAKKKNHKKDCCSSHMQPKVIRDTVRVVEKIIETKIEELKVEGAAEIKNVCFDINSAEVKSDEAVKVNEISEYLKNNPETVVFVIGNADKKTGSSAYNKNLSAKRSCSVSDMLKEKGIEASRIIALIGEGLKTDDIFKGQVEKNRSAVCVITKQVE